MTDFAIRVENLGKRYHIGGAAVKYRTLRDSMSECDSKTLPAHREKGTCRYILGAAGCIL